MNNAIFMVTNEKYFVYTKACINSIKDNYPNHPEIILVCKYTNKDEYFLNYFRNLENVILKTYHYEDLNLCLNPIGDDIIYQKLFLWNNTFNTDYYDNILHLDCDTLVLKPLDYLFKQDQFYIAQNFENLPHISTFGSKGDDILRVKLNTNNLPKDTNCIMANAGVFVIPKKYRNINHYNTLLKLGYEFNDYIAYADQSIISLWCHYNNIPIVQDYTFNFQTTFSTLMNKFKLEDLSIIHFSGYKPDSDDYNNWNWVSEKFKKWSLDLFKRYA